MVNSNLFKKYTMVFAYSNICCAYEIAREVNDFYDNSSSSKIIIIANGKVAEKLNVKQTALMNIDKIPNNSKIIPLVNRIEFIKVAIKMCDTWKTDEVKLIVCSKHSDFFKKILKSQKIDLTSETPVIISCMSDSRIRQFIRKIQEFVPGMKIMSDYFKIKFKLKSASGL